MTYIILIECPDAKGLIHTITGVLYRNMANIVSNHEFVEHDNSRFFMRTEIEGDLNKGKINKELAAVLPADSSIFISEKRKKGVVILVTKEHHCLGELLVRNKFDELNATILAVIGNHNDLENITRQFAVPFFCISHENKTREDHEKELQERIQEFMPDYIILAKYMRILSHKFIAMYPNRIINIHHSFLPAFVGANPYRQAYERGVKIIGATAHFVNDNLDEGPIIVQQVIPTDHSITINEMSQMGRDVEKITLAKALKLVFDDRIFVSRNKTIIFD
jgi:formyltetrahydrofolate deformylase